jgi:uncharacterized CHY-type Zn-finger protein
MRVVHGEAVYGSTLDDQTRCAHYHGDLDIIAIRFKCCGRWFPCRECHDETDDHTVETWPELEFNKAAVLCGSCGRKLTVNEYLACSYRCPACGSGFNPGCGRHLDLYFDLKSGLKE